MTNAQFLYAISRLSRTAAKATAELVDGIWNPQFNDADGTHYAQSVCEDVREWLRRMDEKIGEIPVQSTEDNEISK